MSIVRYCVFRLHNNKKKHGMCCFCPLFEFVLLMFSLSQLLGLYVYNRIKKSKEIHQKDNEDQLEFRHERKVWCLSRRLVLRM